MRREQISVAIHQSYLMLRVGRGDTIDRNICVCCQDCIRRWKSLCWNGKGLGFWRLEGLSGVIADHDIGLSGERVSQGNFRGPRKE